MSLIDDLVEAGVVKSDAVINAFRAVPRQGFLPPEVADESDSLPLTVAMMLELLQPQSGQKALDVGSGSGWSTALLATMVGDAGSVVAIEIEPSLYELGKKHLDAAGFTGRVDCRQGTWEEQLREDERFDRILVSAVDAAVPARLRAALTEGGILVMPVEEGVAGDQALVKLTRRGNEFDRETVPGFQFVPLL